VLVLALVQASPGAFGLGLGAIVLVGALEFLRGTSSMIAVLLYGPALLASAEFGYWSLELQMTVSQSNQSVLRRAAVVSALVLAGAMITAVCVTLVGLLAGVTA